MTANTKMTEDWIKSQVEKIYGIAFHADKPDEELFSLLTDVYQAGRNEDSIPDGRYINGIRIHESNISDYDRGYYVGRAEMSHLSQ